MVSVKSSEHKSSVESFDFDQTHYEAHVNVMDKIAGAIVQKLKKREVTPGSTIFCHNRPVNLLDSNEESKTSKSNLTIEKFVSDWLNLKSCHHAIELGYYDNEHDNKLNEINSNDIFAWIGRYYIWKKVQKQRESAEEEVKEEQEKEEETKTSQCTHQRTELIGPTVINRQKFCRDCGVHMNPLPNCTHTSYYQNKCMGCGQAKPKKQEKPWLPWVNDEKYTTNPADIRILMKSPKNTFPACIAR
jgi:hypothetical protein